MAAAALRRLKARIASRAEVGATAARAWCRQAPRAARRPETIALAVIILAGLALRIAFVIQWRPALIGFPDAAVYIEDARTGIFNDPLRVGGYSAFLVLLHAIRPHLAFVIEVQHVLGLASGLLLFGAVRRAGLKAWIALVPVAVVVLGGSELFVEHAPLTEALFIFLVDLLLLLAFAAPLLTRGAERRAACLFGVAALILLVGPILTSEYDYRFTIPAFGALAATAAIGGSGVLRGLARWRLRARLRPRRPAPPPPGEPSV